MTHTGATHKPKKQIKVNQDKHDIKEKRYDCTTCGETFEYEKDLKNHERGHTSKTFPCKECDRKFSNSNQLKKHELSHRETPKAEKLFCCRACDKEFTRKDDLKKHERTHSSNSPSKDGADGKNRFSCDLCESKFNKEIDLKTHEKTHTCPHFKKSRCMYGPRGENEKGKCNYSHPRRCLYDQTIGCKKANCTFFHSESGKSNLSNARPARTGFHKGSQVKGPSQNMAFLGESQMFKLFDMYLQQKMDQDQNNNGRGKGPQNPKK